MQAQPVPARQHGHPAAPAQGDEILKHLAVLRRQQVARVQQGAGVAGDPVVVFAAPDRAQPRIARCQPAVAAQLVLAVLAIEQRRHRVEHDARPRPGHHRIEPPVVEGRQRPRGRLARQPRRGGVHHHRVGPGQRLDQRVGKPRRAWPERRLAQHRAGPGPDIGARTEERRAAALSQPGQRARQVLGIPHVVLVAEGQRRVVRHVGMAEQPQRVRRHPPAGPVHEVHRLRHRRREAAHDVAGRVGRGVVAHPELPVAVVLCRDRGQLLGQVRRPVAGRKQDCYGLRHCVTGRMPRVVTNQDGPVPRRGPLARRARAIGE